MKIGYSFDTGFLTLALTDSLPEKWILPWNEIRKHRKMGYVIEPVIAETFYQLIKKGKVKQQARDDILKIKAINSINITELNDNDSLLAGAYRQRFKKLSLSYNDCYILATAFRLKLKIYTTDGRLARAAKDINVSFEYLPIKEPKKTNPQL